MIAVLALGASFNRRSSFLDLQACFQLYGSKLLHEIPFSLTSCSWTFTASQYYYKTLHVIGFWHPSINSRFPWSLSSVFTQWSQTVGRHFWRLASNLPLNLGFLYLLMFFKDKEKISWNKILVLYGLEIIV